jgi:hypothetical protein
MLIYMIYVDIVEICLNTNVLKYTRFTQLIYFEIV